MGKVTVLVGPKSEEVFFDMFHKKLGIMWNMRKISTDFVLKRIPYNKKTDMFFYNAGKLSEEELNLLIDKVSEVGGNAVFLTKDKFPERDDVETMYCTVDVNNRIYCRKSNSAVVKHLVSYGMLSLGD